MEPCINHPDHAAIEHCETCGDPLCDLCLWYADDGRRLCETHAEGHEKKGGTVQSPALYEGGIRVREVEEAAAQTAPYQGNQTDLLAAAAALIAGTTILSIFGGIYCLPILSLLLAITALTNRRKGLDEERTRVLGVIGIALSAFGLLPMLFFFCIFLFSLTLGFGSILVNP
ncbi:MAG TPA: B-box zinc finger protein [Anaerolineales bacterium]|nr:B-box zinc finger protein [Anaerolineales bacterium]